MEDLRDATKAVLEKLFDGELPATGYQPDATAVAMGLADVLTAGAQAVERVLVGAPHSQETCEHVERIGLCYEHREHMVDFVVVNRVSPGVDLPLLGCESEVYTSHGVEYNFELWPGSNWPKNGYVWDFRKLLHFRAPRLLYVARVNKERGDRTYARLQALERTLIACATDYATVWSGSRLDVLLLPGGRNERAAARIGHASPQGSISFSPLFG